MRWFTPTTWYEYFKVYNVSELKVFCWIGLFRLLSRFLFYNKELFRQQHSKYSRLCVSPFLVLTFYGYNQTLLLISSSFISTYFKLIRLKIKIFIKDAYNTSLQSKHCPKYSCVKHMFIKDLCGRTGVIPQYNRSILNIQGKINIIYNILYQINFSFMCIMT